MAEDSLYDFSLRTPASICLIGPSQCGKSHLIVDIIRNRQLYFDKPIGKVIYVYYRINDILLGLQSSDPDIILVEDIPTAEKLIEDSCLLILDDVLGELNNRQINDTVTDLFIRKVHHYNFNVILTLQRAFSNVPKTILDNTKYAIYFDSPRYRSMITNFAKKNLAYVQDAFHRATKIPHGYLLFDFGNETPEEYRLRNKIYPSDDDTCVYRSP